MNPWISTRPTSAGHRTHSARPIRRIIEIVRLGSEATPAVPFAFLGCQGRQSTVATEEAARAAFVDAERVADIGILQLDPGADPGSLAETLRRLLLPVYVAGADVPDDLLSVCVARLPVSENPATLVAALDTAEAASRSRTGKRAPTISVVQLGPNPVAGPDSAIIRAEKLACIRELAAGLAHEMNNLVTPVAGYAQLVRSEVEDPAIARKLDIIEQSAFRASRMINDLLAFSRLAPIETETIDSSTWLANWCQDNSARLQSEGIDFQSTLEDLPALELDRARIEQAMDQVLRNAVQAVETSGSKIRFHAETRVIAEGDRARLRIHRDRRQNNYFADRGPMVGDRVVVITIHDDGPGIAADLLDRVYYPFFTTRDPDEGPGLGLSVAFGVLQAHGGTLSVVSSDPKGVDAHLVIPVPRA